MNNFNFVDYKYKINENINLLISKYYNNNLEMKKIYKKMKSLKNAEIDQKYINELQEKILLFDYNKNVLVKNIKLFVSFVNELELLKKVEFKNLESSESDEEILETNEEETNEEETNIKKVIEGIQDLFLNDDEKENFFNFIDNFNKEDEQKKEEIKKAFNNLINKDLTVISFFKPNETTNNNIIDALDDVEMNISNFENEPDEIPPNAPSVEQHIIPKKKRVISYEQKLKNNERKRELRAIKRKQNEKK